MKQSEYGRKLLQLWEGCKTVAYQDGGGVWTIGYGHTGPEVKKGLVWTQAQCEAAYLADIKPRERTVLSLVKVPLNQNQFDALVSFVYNVGGAAFKKSTLLTLLNIGKYESVPLQLARWNRIKGEPSDGLTNRRNKEIKLFTEPT